MNFFFSSQLLSDEDDFDDADDFNFDFDEDYEYLSDEEFEVTIEYDENESDYLEMSVKDFCMSDDLDAFGDFDASEETETLAEKDLVDEE